MLCSQSTPNPLKRVALMPLVYDVRSVSLSGRQADQSGNSGQVRPVCRQPGDRLRRSSDSARRVLTIRAIPPPPQKRHCVHLFVPPDLAPHRRTPAAAPPQQLAECSEQDLLFNASDNNLFPFFLFECVPSRTRTRTSIVKSVLGQCCPHARLCVFQSEKNIT